jgi:hypothetical protein
VDLIGVPAVRARIAELARATDTAIPQRVPSGNYEAESISTGVMRCFAPWGCVWTIGANGDSLLTECLKKDCSFEWSAAREAFALLDAAKALPVEPLALYQNSSDGVDRSEPNDTLVEIYFEPGGEG